VGFGVGLPAGGSSGLRSRLTNGFPAAQSFWSGVSLSLYIWEEVNRHSVRGTRAVPPRPDPNTARSGQVPDIALTEPSGSSARLPAVRVLQGSRHSSVRCRSVEENGTEAGGGCGRPSPGKTNGRLGRPEPAVEQMVMEQLEEQQVPEQGPRGGSWGSARGRCAGGVSRR